MKGDAIMQMQNLIWSNNANAMGEKTEGDAIMQMQILIGSNDGRWCNEH